MSRCRYCGRKLIENEKYCHFCEENVSHATGEEDFFPPKKKFSAK